MSTFDNIVTGVKTAARNFATSFQTENNDKVVQAAALSGSVGGAVCGIIVATAFWPVSIATGLAGSFILAVGNWNGDFKSRALSALIGFPLGAVFGPALVGAMAGGALGVKGGHALSAHLQKTEQAEQNGTAPARAEGKSSFDLSGLTNAFTRALKGITAKSSAPSSNNRQDPPAPQQ